MKTLGLLVVAIILSFAFESEACSCLAQHPQVQYCSSDYAIVVKVLSGHNIDDQTIEYNVDIRKIWKASDAAYEYLQNEVLTTSSSSAACGVTLKIGVNYVIFGSGTNIGSCQYIQEYSRLRPVQRSYIKSGYKKGCQCKIIPLNILRPGSQNPSICQYHPTNNDCQFTFGVCVPTWTNGVRGCAWKKSTEYQNCINPPQ